MPPQEPPPSIGTGPRLLAAVFGLVFAGIGLSVLAFMWLSPRDEFGAPPLFFRVFASFIAIPFVAIGATLAYGAFTGRSLQSRAQSHLAQLHAGSSSPTSAPPPTDASYRCARCGAPLGKDADVSPSGDVKCTFCNTWFNIHRPTA